jgi:hypothetical protein
MILGVAGVVCAIVDHFNEVTWYRQGAYWLLYADKSDDNPNINGLFTFFNSLITFQNIVPISLYISIEFVRTVQALFIYWDDDIKYAKTKTRTMARSWNLSDECVPRPLVAPVAHAPDSSLPPSPRGRQPRPDRVHLFGQDWHSHAERNDLSAVLDRRHRLQGRR